MSNSSDIALLTRFVADRGDDLLRYLVRRLRCCETAAMDLEEDATLVTEHLRNCRHTRTPVYRGTIDNVLG